MPKKSSLDNLEEEPSSISHLPSVYKCTVKNLIAMKEDPRQRGNLAEAVNKFLDRQDNNWLSKYIYGLVETSSDPEHVALAVRDIIYLFESQFSLNELRETYGNTKLAPNPTIDRNQIKRP